MTKKSSSPYKNYKGKNGYASSFRKITTNEGTKWLRVSKTPSSRKKK